jgi:protein-tyrosine phosphatase
MRTKILVLCHGNLNRSPAAAKILARHRPGLLIQCAGVKATDGHVIAKKMRTTLEACGYESTGRSQRVTRVMVDWAELILVMDEKNAGRLMENWPEESVQRKIRYVGDLVGLTKISDPHFATTSDAHLQVVRTLEKAFASPAFDSWLCW